MEDACLRARLAEYAEREMEYWDFSGAVRVTRGGEGLYAGCRGEANREFGVKVTPDTRFTVGSVTKQFTAFAVMLLWDRGLLSPDAEANQYLGAGMRVPDGVIVHHLLCHASGLYNFYNFADDFYIGADRLPYDRKAYLRDWINRKPVQAPGKAFNYNNANYNLLAWIIENLSGRTYAEFLRRELFEPLGMRATAWDDGLAVLPGKAENYMYNYGVIARTPYVNPLFHAGAGGLVTTCGDLQRWYACLRDRRLLSARAYARFFTENLNHYCYGLERKETDGAVIYAHGGDFNGVAAYTLYAFDEDACITILSNNESLNQYWLGGALLDILHGKAPARGTRPEAYPVSREELYRYTGTYLPGKIHIEVKDDQLYLVRVNQNVHVQLSCVAPGVFARRLEESAARHVLWPQGAPEPSVWGFERVSREFI